MDRRQLRAVLLDLEGTVVPSDFVHQILDPHARSNVQAFVQAHLSSEDVRADIRRLHGEHAADVRHGRRPPAWNDELPALGVDSVARYVHWLMERARDSTALRSLQGRVWAEALRSGELRCEVHPDVPAALRRWKAAGLLVGSISSISAPAQRALYAHTACGDLAPLVDRFFDRATGPPAEADTYRRLAAEFGVQPAAVLFLADRGGHLDVAAGLGIKTLRCVRSGAGSPGEARHPVVRSLDGVLVG